MCGMVGLVVLVHNLPAKVSISVLIILCEGTRCLHTLNGYTDQNETANLIRKVQICIYVLTLPFETEFPRPDGSNRPSNAIDDYLSGNIDHGMTRNVPTAVLRIMKTIIRESLRKREGEGRIASLSF